MAGILLQQDKIRDFLKPLLSPAIPINYKLEGGLYPGFVILVDGVAPANSKRFAINFTAGYILEGPHRSNVLFHFNPRFDENYVARNCFIKGRWEKEEGEKEDGFPFKKEIPFRITVLVEGHLFKVAVDGVNFCEFKHRYRIQDVSYLQVSGDVVIHKIDFTETASAQYNKILMQHAGRFWSSVHSPVNHSTLDLFSPPVPWTQPIPWGLTVGTAIYIAGKPKMNASRFNFNFEKEDKLKNGQPDVMFHFNPRFNGPEHTVVRNTRVSGKWGEEEVGAPPCPFTPSLPFDVMVLCEATRFLVAVNGRHYISFDHRQPLEQARVLTIAGDIVLTHVRITQPTKS